MSTVGNDCKAEFYCLYHFQYRLTFPNAVTSETIDVRRDAKTDEDDVVRLFPLLLLDDLDDRIRKGIHCFFFPVSSYTSSSSNDV